MSQENTYKNIIENRQRGYDLNRPQYNIGKHLLKKINFTEDQKNKSKALDLGCGIGEFSDIMRKSGFKKVVCVDGLEDFVNQVKERGIEAHRVNLEFEKLPFKDNEFDLVVSLEVIEHLWNMDHYLSEIKRVLKPGGKLIVSTPNYNYLRFRIYYILGRFEGVVSSRDRHKKFLTDKSFYKEISEKFNVREYVGSVGFLGRAPKIKNFFIKNRILKNLFSLQLGIIATNKDK